jgi:DNA-binding FadR family transcriptional regulator
LSESIEDQIKEAICDGHYHVGDKLPPERTLAEQFGVSRAVVREALRSLEREGLLTIKTGAHGGAYVIHMENKSIENSLRLMLSTGQLSHDEIQQARMFVEPPIAAEAALKATPKDIARMKEANQARRPVFGPMMRFWSTTRAPGCTT